MEKKVQKYTSPEIALLKLQKYCAYQERSHVEVTSKLYELGVYGEKQDEIIISLIQDNFLNEERFAKAYARGKFNVKSWGRNRIKQELKMHKISSYCLKKAIAEIDEDEYFQRLCLIIEKKSNLLNLDDDRFKLRQKLYAYVQQKGYEVELINAALDSFFKKNK